MSTTDRYPNVALDIQVTRQDIEKGFAALELDWGDGEDADDLLDLLLTTYSTTDAWTWLMFYNKNLDGTPMQLLRTGRTRQVFIEAREISKSV